MKTNKVKSGKGSKETKKAKVIVIADVIADYTTKVKTAKETAKVLARVKKADLFAEYLKVANAADVADATLEDVTVKYMVGFLVNYYEPNKRAKAGKVSTKVEKELVLAYDEVTTEKVTEMAEKSFVLMQGLHANYKANNDWAVVEDKMKEIWDLSGIEEAGVAAIYNKAVKSPFGFRFSVADVELTACVWAEKGGYRMSVYNKAGERVVFFK